MMWGNGGYGMFGGYGGWGMGLHSLFWLVVLGLIVWAVVTLVRPTTGPSGFSSGTSQSSSGLSILEERYARGEIDREEYLQKKKDLGL